MPHFEQASAQGFPVLPPLGQGAFLWWLINWLASAPSRFSSKSLFGEGNFDAPLSIILSFLFSLFLLFLATESVIEAWELTFVLAGLQLAASHTWLPRLWGAFGGPGFLNPGGGFGGGAASSKPYANFISFGRETNHYPRWFFPRWRYRTLSRFMCWAEFNCQFRFLSPSYHPLTSLASRSTSLTQVSARPRGGGVSHTLSHQPKFSKRTTMPNDAIAEEHHHNLISPQQMFRRPSSRP